MVNELYINACTALQHDQLSPSLTLKASTQGSWFLGFWIFDKEAFALTFQPHILPGGYHGVEYR